MTRTIHAYSSARQKRSSTHLDLVPPLLIDLLLRLFPLLTSLNLTSYLHNLQFRQVGSERLVERELIAQTDVSTFGRLGQNPVFSASERL